MTMTALTIIIYAATVLIWAAALYIATRTIKRQQRQIREQQQRIDRYIKCNNCTNPHYIVNTTEDGCIGVERFCYEGGYIHSVAIKLFTDEDEAYNLREAEDLAKHLNEK